MPGLSVQGRHFILLPRQTARQHFEAGHVKLTFTIPLGTNIRNNTHDVSSHFRGLESEHRVLRPIIFRTKNRIMLFLHQLLRFIKKAYRKTVQILMRSSQFNFFAGKSLADHIDIQVRR